MDDSQAISAILAGDRNRYEELVGKYKRMVYAIAWSHLGNADLAEDAAQETFVKAFCYLGTLREPGRFSCWLARIARNICSSFRRRAKREDAFKRRWAILEAAEPHEPDESRQSLHEEMWSSFAELSEIHREALTVFYIEGKSIEDMAAVLGISEPAARTRLHRARAALREHLAAKLEDTLDTLQPSRRFTHSVMVLLPLCPKGAAMGSGGVLALFGKCSASVSFVLWYVLAPLIVMATVIKLELANIIDAPQNSFRKTLVRRFWLVLLLGSFAFGAVWALLTAILQPRGGPEASFALLSKIMAVCLLPLTYMAIRTLRVNRGLNAVFLLALSIGTLAVYAAVGFFGAPASTISYFVLAYLIVAAVAGFSGKVIPGRHDYNIFLRCATGGVQETADQPSLPRRISDLQFASFARFLGEQYLVWDYSLKPDRIILRASPPLSGSRITITREGECEADAGSRNLRSISKAVGREVDRSELEGTACRAVTAALGRFLDGDTTGARSVLTAQSDESILRTPTSKSLHWRLLAVFSVLFWLWMLFGPISHHHGR